MGGIVINIIKLCVSTSYDTSFSILLYILAIINKLIAIGLAYLKIIYILNLRHKLNKHQNRINLIP